MRGKRGVVMLGAWLLAAGPEPAAALPDLVPEIFDVTVGVSNVDAADVAEGCAGGTTNRRLVRFGLRTRNVGNTDLFFGDPQCPNCFDNPGDQCGNSLFHCGPAHGHPHFESFSDADILDSNGVVVAQGHKAGFCLIDVECAAPRFQSCNFQGISAGCNDVYGSGLPCQYVDITDVNLPPATYRLRVRLDPDGVITETSEGNNAVEVPLQLGGPAPGCPPAHPSSDVPKTIADLGTASSTLSVPVNVQIGRVRIVGLRGVHTYVGDLEIHLRSPAGTDAIVMNRVCGAAANFDLALDDLGGSPIACPPTDGQPHVPSTALSAFAGESSAGTWTLSVFDRAAQDEGRLDGWGLEICGATGPCAGGPATSCLDEFLCYSTRTPLGLPRFTPVPDVSLAGPFENASVDVSEPEQLCTPADKDGIGMVDAVTHLTGYRMRQGTRHVRQLGVRVATELGVISVDTLRPDLLLAPTHKGLTAPPSFPDPAQHDVDHYRCYRVRRTPGTDVFPRTPARVVDQFTDPIRTLSLSKPRHLCLPVAKDGGGVEQPGIGLLCYSARPAPGEHPHDPQPGLYVANQFGQQRAATMRERELCLPATLVP
jgi:subtilisin-like proprotein convertase family protein